MYDGDGDGDGDGDVECEFVSLIIPFIKYFIVAMAKCADTKEEDATNYKQLNLEG